MARFFSWVERLPRKIPRAEITAKAATEITIILKTSEEKKAGFRGAMGRAAAEI